MVFGHRCILQTDHKPLLKIFGNTKGIPVYTANRLQRWVLTLKLHNFDIQFEPTARFSHADLLSHLMSSNSGPDEDYIFVALQIESNFKVILNDSISALPVTSEMIVKETSRDSVLQGVIQHINLGWPQTATQPQHPDIRQFFTRRNSLQIVQDYIMCGDRVVIPARFRKRLHLLAKHRRRRRNLCLTLQFLCRRRRIPEKTNLESWPIPSKPCPEVFRTRNTTTTATLEILEETFARRGNPRTLVSAPYHPQLNGQAESGQAIVALHRPSKLQRSVGYSLLSFARTQIN
ncbi:uncharacterized protein LOC129728452 [Wyeomyia smithii]|uniref:uncharacterized protein LOC129728452 n=1 Tax=Wyeomyia smithii TaxID=174621 RepID=UPI00246801DB|nr:uncharacterized protein LOC129728452 [Wyeomyia smithii]